MKHSLEHRNFKYNKKGCWAHIEIKIEKTWWKLVIVYNNTSLKEMEEQLETLLGRKTDDKVIIGGDLNARIGIV